MQAMVVWVAVLLALAPTASAVAAEPQVPPVEKRELIFCAERMTHEEREAYRTRMRDARTVEEKEAVRLAHQAQMQARAAAPGGQSCEPYGRAWREGQGK